jgi:PAS domain S-box-containing protein
METKPVYEQGEPKVNLSEKELLNSRLAEKSLKKYCDELKQQLEKQIAETETLNEKLKQKIAADKHTEAVLRENEARYRGIFENTKNGVAVYKAVNDGEDFIFRDFNKAGEKIENLKRENVIGKSVLDVFPSVKEFGLFQIFQNVWRSGKPEYHPVTVYKDERIQGWRENFVYKLPSGEIVAVYTDRTEEKKAEESLRKSEAQKKAILEGLCISLLFVDENLSILWANRAAAAWAKKSPEEMIGHKCHAFRTDPEKPCDDCPALNAFHTKTSHHAVIYTRDGRIWNVKADPVFDDKGELLGVLDIAEDITEKIRMEAQIRQAQRMDAIASLAGGIAHQFNNALFGVTGNIDLLKIVLPDSPKTAKYLNALSDCAQRMVNLTRQLTAYAHGGKYQVKNISLNEFIENSMSSVRQNISSSISVSTDLAKDIPPVNVDVHQMQMVFSAIMNNAAEAIEDSGHIRISTRHYPGSQASGTYICLTVADNGKGMDEEIKTRIFEPFFSTKFKGRGLGMAAVYGIVTNHEGWISVDSTPGKGTVVRVYLPAVRGSG